MKGYLDWVREQPCMICGSAPSEPHHIKGVGHFSGTGMKAPDYLAMPLCRQHHMMMHRTPGIWVTQWEYVVRTLAAALQAGVIEITQGDKK